MPLLRRIAVTTTSIIALTSSVFVGGGVVAAAPTVRNGDLAFSEGGGVFTQAPREGTTHYAADGNMAKYSPDGRRIAYTGAAGYIGYGIFVKTLGSSTQEVLSDDQPVSGLAWAPDGQSLVVASGDQLLRVSVSTGDAVPILTSSGPVRDPAWSPDGTRIAFTTGPDIKLVRPDGTGLRTFTTGGGANNHPDWSPDSKTIAFITDRYVVGQDARAYAELVTLPRSGKGEPVRVSHRAYPMGLYYMGVAWSPDGRKIAALQFNANHLPNDEDTDERFKVRAYLPDGSSSNSLTGPIYGDDGPEGLDWAPKLP